jgi:hypothetical protein
MAVLNVCIWLGSDVGRMGGSDDMSYELGDRGGSIQLGVILIALL